MEQSDSFALAANELRALDHERYLASLMLPADRRGAAQAILAFASEVAAVRERVSEPSTGEIRLQWWIDALEGQGHGAVRSNPVADALFQTLDRHDLPTGPLVRLLAARRFDLYNDPMIDLSQFEGYSGETVSILFQYMAMILNREAADQSGDAAGHLGVALALAGHLRAFGYNAARGQLFLPLSVFTAHGVREREIYAGKPSEALDASLMQISELCAEHHAKAQAAIAALPRDIRPAFASIALLPHAMAQHGALKGEAAFQPTRTASPFAQLLRMMWWSIKQGRHVSTRRPDL